MEVVVVVITQEVEVVDQEEIMVEVTVEVMVVTVAMEVVITKMVVEVAVKIGMEVTINNNLNSHNSKTKAVGVVMPTNGHNITNKWRNGNKRTNSGNNGNSLKVVVAKLYFETRYLRK